MTKEEKRLRNKIVQKGRTEMDRQIRDGKYDEQLKWLAELDRKFIELKKLLEEDQR